jgi:hypothetical protein
MYAQVVTPESTASASTPNDPGGSWSDPPTFQAYDPVEAGVIDEQYAYRVVEEFKTSFVTNFPFVLVETDAATLRQQQPFLFHAILTVAVYDSPRIQCFLGAELRRQVARIIEHSRKTLEVLQGLLIYGAWYAPHHLLVMWFRSMSRICACRPTAIVSQGTPNLPNTTTFLQRKCTNCNSPSQVSCILPSCRPAARNYRTALRRSGTGSRPSEEETTQF